MPNSPSNPIQTLDNDQSFPSWETMLEWQYVWLRAVAESWENAEFRAALLTDARAALKQKLGYELPRTMHLIVFEPEHGGYVVQDGVGNWVLPKNELHLPLPPKPKDEYSQAIALADYNNAGRSYPFTTF